MTDPAPLLVVVGPTATGKTSLAVRLALRLQGEIVSADSVQVYRHFDVGSGKPTDRERALVPHHLIDIVDPLDELEANVWAERALHAISDVSSRGRVPIVCGGTFLWVRALLFGLAEAPPGDADIRSRHKQFAEAEGRLALHEQLRQVDPQSAGRLHPNDLVRVSRALEVFELSGKPLSELQAAHGFRASRFRALLLGVTWEKDEYERRLIDRVQAMVVAGWRQEVEDLIGRGYGEARAMDAVGYRQVRDAVRADSDTSDEQLIEAIVRVTRVFARRQRTWLREEPVRLVPSAALSDHEALESVTREVQAFLRR
jgi:tRNA dimethylallyltransferase